MRVWIIGSKRYGDSTEVCWEVTWWGTRTDPDDSDSAPEFCHEFKTLEAAMAHAKRTANNPGNHWGLAQVREMRLERVEGNHYDWEQVGDMIEVGAEN